MKEIDTLKALGTRPKLDEETKQHCRGVLEELFKLYEETDPAIGEKSQSGKAIKADTAISNISYLANILTGWAENQIFGRFHKMATSEKRYIGKDESISDLHENETMWYEEKLLFDIFSESYLSNGNNLEFVRAAIANIINITPMVTAAGQRRHWQSPLSTALYALNNGQIDRLLQPTNTKQQGNAHDIKELKLVSIKHLHKLIGEGWKKTAAQQSIADYCGVTFEVVKKWEREFKDTERNKEAFIKIQKAAQVLPKIKYREMSRLEKSTVLAIASIRLEENHSSKNKTMEILGVKDIPLSQDLAFGIYQCVELDLQFPLDDLKERLTEAGMRTAK